MLAQWETMRSSPMQAIAYAAMAMPRIVHGSYVDEVYPRLYRMYSAQTMALDEAKPRMTVITANEIGHRNLGLL